MNLNKQVIIQPNSEYERKQELLSLFKTDLTDADKLILKECKTEDHESIGMIGCLLEEDSRINSIRLLIASRNKSNPELVQMARNLLIPKDENLLIQSLSDTFLFESDSLSEYEDELLFILFGLLKFERNFNSNEP